MSGKPNRLSRENSPYLLQHARNAVDWFPWGEQAFEKARKENKPLFISIGYSTCHWCHVMERESFEDGEIGDILNEHFVCVKVDREERPDVDQLYMSYATAVSGSGGWPLSIFATPEKKPFLVATYLPPRNVGHRKGMKELSLEIQTLWESQQEKIVNSSEEMFAYVLKIDPAVAGEISEEAFQVANHSLLTLRDGERGGFGGDKKFPCPQNLLYLMGQFAESGEANLLETALDALKAMRLSGLFDHVGFGYHRYSTDPAWHLPHFEKMLYDQAMLLMAFAEAWKLTGEAFHKTAAREIALFVKNELYQPDQGFFSAYDADSEGKEGRFYVFSMEELREMLAPGEIEFLKKRFGFTDQGNFREEATGLFTGENLFTLGGLPAREGLNFEAHLKEWEPLRGKIAGFRSRRVKPGLDDKVIMEWNGMMAGAFARASSALGDSGMLELARGCMDAIRENLVNADGKLMRYRRGEFVSGSGFLGDYAWYVFACLELYSATLEISYLDQAVRTQETALELFFREDRGKFSVNPKEKNDLLKDIFEDYDGAYPSAASVNAHNMLRLDNHVHCPELREIALRNLNAVASGIAQYPAGHAGWLMALEYLRLDSGQVLIVGESSSLSVKEAVEVVKRHAPKRTACVLKHEKNEEVVNKLMPWTEPMKVKSGQVLIYPCRNFSCSLPLTSPQDLAQALGSPQSRNLAGISPASRP